MAVEALDNDPAQEKAMLGLRLDEGISRETLAAASGASPADLDRRLHRLQRFVRSDGGRVTLTPEGNVVSNAVLSELFF